MMPHHRARNVQALPSGNLGAQAQLRVVGIREKFLVESADLIQHRAPVHGRASVRPQDLFHAIVLPFVQLTAAAPAILAVGINQVARFIDPARILMHQDFRSGHTDVRPSVERTRQLSQPIRFRFSIIIKQRDELGIGRLEALVVGGTKPAVVRIAGSVRLEPREEIWYLFRIPSVPFQTSRRPSRYRQPPLQTAGSNPAG